MCSLWVASAGHLDDYASTKSLWFASDALFGQDETLDGVQMVPLGCPDGHKGKWTLTSVKLSEYSLPHNLSFLEHYIADLALYNSFHAGINILQ
jgi:hypothetical protein